MRRWLFGCAVLLALTLALTKCTSPSGQQAQVIAPPATPTTTSSPQLLAAQALCTQTKLALGSMTITTPTGAPITTLRFHEPFLIHAQFPYPLELTQFDKDPNQSGITISASRVGAQNTIEDSRATNVGLGHNVDATQVVYPFQLPAVDSVLPDESPDLVPGIYCIDIIGFGSIDGSDSLYGEQADLVIEVSN